MTIDLHAIGDRLRLQIDKDLDRLPLPIALTLEHLRRAEDEQRDDASALKPDNEKTGNRSQCGNIEEH